MSNFKSLFSEEEYNNLRNNKKEYYKLYRRYKLHGDINYRNSFNYKDKIDGWDNMTEKEKKKCPVSFKLYIPLYGCNTYTELLSYYERQLKECKDYNEVCNILEQQLEEKIDE
eukprot:Pgem_evm1s228